MEQSSSVEPEGVLEVRRWKEAVGQELESLGFEEFHRRAHEKFADMRRRMEEKRQARQVLEHKPAA